ncbi:bis(5'-nucleosyl)-tetraphosphatase (symmetrical) YqeK [Clostridium sp. LIBA-8841]|uniref:bis(5'-nucleosyl)-tetraphosphatase (symmetrical) YqeK n=1 Tax=Clostridium sp. LIBA-8841 TaxID=2987530 RepID=UPI002AC6178F|nr:bis(5'-nucleosyl)-tetraphosphatase (symmetrical) YqeK [Clostridium sp. LIBA-8841]MDZ5253074.1 bis(5'-nucleosyl)-tetraphosphatase (symmetrical) YqeK [Clostridium sp. LIBA-8841]
MWSLERINEYVKETLKGSRYSHTLGVVETAKELAKLNGEDVNKAELAALIHDVAKYVPVGEQIKILEERDYDLDEITLKSPQVLHGFVGAIIAKEKFGIEDEDVLDAVKYHTLAKRDMSTLEKIIYIADYIEPGRDFLGVQELRKITKEDLDEGVLKGLENTILFVIKQGNLIHPLTIEARNFLIMNKNA